MAASILHPAALRPWRPMSDTEWEAIRPFLPPHEGPGRPSDKRRTLDAIFWIAASREPWRALPSHMGRGESVARTLRRWARAGWVERLLIAVSDHPLGGGCQVLRRMSWLICRTFRRMLRILGDPAVLLARRLRLRDAWPADPLRLPNPHLSEIGKHCVAAAQPVGLGLADWVAMGLHRTAEAMAQAGMRLVRLAKGNRYRWRLR